MRRRDALKLGVGAGAGALAAAALVGRPKHTAASDDFDLPSPATTPFVDPLPLPPQAQTVAKFGAQDCPSDIVDSPRTKFYRLVEEEALVKLHRDLPATRVWRYRDVNQPAASPFGVGPTFKSLVYDTPTLGGANIVRIKNNLPDPHIGFGVNRTTTHLHGGHVEARSDGFPEDSADDPAFHPVREPRDEFDYCYALKDPGFAHGAPDPTDRPATLWYHDHLLDFTGPNVYRGLAGFFLVFDQLDADDETGKRFWATNLRLPSGAFDVPLVLQDRRLDRNAQLVYVPGDHDGFLGDKHLVNGKIQPYFIVKRRKYRFRLLNGANARFYMIQLADSRGRTHPFDVIGTEAGLTSRPLRGLDRVLLSNAQRRDIVIDFSRFAENTELYLENRLDQDSGRGPGGDFDDPDLLDPRQAIRLLKFIVRGEAADPSRVPDVLRPFAAITQDEIRRSRRRHFEFERRRGAWAINGEFIDIDRPNFIVPINTPEVWTFENGGGGWWHPIHVHLEFMHVLSRNGKAPPLIERDGIAKADVITLGPNDVVEVFLKFRDHPGRWVFHCHNVEHEDAFMMLRFDIAG
jgi:FtsP/CotA-like multicopper oxidase with cupredoxin domain